MPTHRDRVRSYYEQNTSLFLAFNRARKAENIHRSLWTAETRSLDEALNAINRQILHEIQVLRPSQVRLADLGCGVGASLLYIFPRLTEPVTAFGLTLSPTQARLARRFAQAAGLAARVYFLEGDFTAVPACPGSLDVIYSVEAVIHAEAPERYFQEAGRLLRPGGRLILVDDYQTARELSAQEQKWLQAFRDGWQVPGVMTVVQAQAFAVKYGLQLEKSQDLTPFLRLRVLPGPAAEALLALGNVLPIRHAIVPSMLGSLALQQCLAMQVIEYRFLVFEKMTSR